MSKVAEQETIVGENEEVIDVNATQEEGAEEIEAATQEEKPAFEIPDKFRDKSIEDVVKSYQELERTFGQRNNEIGELRKINQQLMELQLSEKPAEVPRETQEQLDVDSLLDNPSEALSKAIENNPRLKKLEEALVQDSRDKAKSSFESRHPNWQETAASEDFQKWVQGSQSRMSMFQNAHQNYDYGLAGELFDWYNQVHKPVESASAEELNKATTESGGAKIPKKSKIYRRSDLQKMRQFDPDKFDSMQDEIIQAYRDGRVR